MPAMADVQCPECGTSIPITMVVTGATRDRGSLIVHAEPDLTDVWAHAWTHDHE